jgi:hypothetical protein
MTAEQKAKILALNLDPETGHQDDHYPNWNKRNCRCKTPDCKSIKLSRQAKIKLVDGEYVGYCGGGYKPCWFKYCLKKGWDDRLDYAVNKIADILNLSDRTNINKNNIFEITGLPSHQKYHHVAVARNREIKTKRKRIVNEENNIEEEEEIIIPENKKIKLNQKFSTKFTKDIEKELIKIKEETYYENHKSTIWIEMKNKIIRKYEKSLITFNNIKINKNDFTYLSGDQDKYIKDIKKYLEAENNFNTLQFVNDCCQILHCYTVRYNNIIDQLKLRYENGDDFDIIEEFKILWQRNNLDNINMPLYEFLQIN